MMINLPPKEFTHVWNDETSFEEKVRLSPVLMETHYLHIWQVKQTAIKAHKRYMKELDGWMDNIRLSLAEYKRKHPESVLKQGSKL